MFDGFSWAAMGVMIALIAVIVTIAGFWMNAALKRTELKITTDVGDDITELSEKTEKRLGQLEASTDLRFSELEASTAQRFTELEASTAQRFTELEAHTDNKLGDIRVDLGQINVRLRQLEHQVAPVFEQLVEAGLVNIPTSGTARGPIAPAPMPAAG